jgi:hypothetical protein
MDIKIFLTSPGSIRQIGRAFYYPAPDAFSKLVEKLSCDRRITLRQLFRNESIDFSLDPMVSIADLYGPRKFPSAN